MMNYFGTSVLFFVIVPNIVIHLFFKLITKIKLEKNYHIRHYAPNSLNPLSYQVQLSPWFCSLCCPFPVCASMLYSNCNSIFPWFFRNILLEWAFIAKCCQLLIYSNTTRWHILLQIIYPHFKNTAYWCKIDFWLLSMFFSIIKSKTVCDLRKPISCHSLRENRPSMTFIPKLCYYFIFRFVHTS